MTRFLEIVLHNWPLKLAAIGLATILYGGLVLSQDARNLAVNIPIEYTPPDGMWVDPLPPVTSVRYLASRDADEPGPGTFRASVDLDRLPQRAGTYELRVQVTSINPDIQVQGVTPAVVQVTLDPLVTKIVPVEINVGEPPTNVEIGTRTATPRTVTVTGQASIVDQVVAARADVAIQPSGLNIDQDVTLVPVDQLGNPRSPIGLSPATARIQIQVLSDAETRTVPINAVITGTPAVGFELGSISVSPSTAVVEGDADVLAALAGADTQALSVSGQSESVTFQTELALPDGIEAVEPVPIRVTVTFRTVTESRSYTVGLRLVGTQAGLEYEVGSTSVLLSIGGGAAELQTVATGSLLGILDVTGLGPGTYDVSVSADLPEGVTLVAASPSSVPVTIAASAAASPSPTSNTAP